MMMDHMIIIIIAALLAVPPTVTFWPPSLKVNLHQKQDFDLFEPDASEEMIDTTQLKQLDLEADSPRLQRMDARFKRSKSVQQVPRDAKSFPDKLLDHIYSGKRQTVTPAALPRSRTHSELHKSHTPVTLNQFGVPSRLIKRSQEQASLPHYDYDYDQFKAEYAEQLQNEMHSNVTLNYTEQEKPEETVKDAVEKIIDVKKPVDCAKEEKRNFGLKSIECLAQDYTKTKTTKDKITLAKRVAKILGIWFLIYVVIAIPLWCQKGWCCCCFSCCCTFCRPKRTMKDVMKYIAKNPPGVMVLPSGKTVSYEPSIYEQEMYRILWHKVRKI